VGTKQAVVAVSIPHLVATSIRFWNLRHKIDRHLLANFGIASAAGGLLGAWLGSRFSSPVLAYILGGLLVFAGLSGLTGLSRKMRFGKKIAWLALIVDGARMPIYFFTSPETVHRLAASIAIMTAGVTIGTVVGGRVLARIPENYFRKIVSLLILALGIVMLTRVAK
jgi:uncharacterized membrane protein YfcA